MTRSKKAGNDFSKWWILRRRNGKGWLVCPPIISGEPVPQAHEFPTGQAALEAYRAGAR